MLEKNIEKKLVEYIKNLKGLIYKFNSQSNSGVPDRLIILPNSKVYFVELKRPSGILSDLQKYQIKRLKSMKQNVCVISSIEDLNNFLRSL